jgi:hypothetical protein
LRSRIPSVERQDGRSAPDRASAIISALDSSGQGLNQPGAISRMLAEKIAL